MKKNTAIFLGFAFLLILFSGNYTFAQERAPRKIILLIGDGMGVAQIYASMVTNKTPLYMERFPVVGLSKTYSADNFITDSGAGGTAIACGVKTKNAAIGVDTLGKPVTSILEYAAQNGLATGMVVTSSVTHATPASFIAHQLSRKADEDIAADFLNTDIDVFIGGGRKFFETRKDKRNLLDSLKVRNYLVTSDINEVINAKPGKLAGFTALEHNAGYADGRGNMLPDAVKVAIRLLNENEAGFFLMVEGSMIDWGGHNRDLKMVIDETLDFDRAVGVALDFAKSDPNTLVIVTADHETGGLSLTGGSIRSGRVKGAFSSKDHTGVMVPVFAYGPGAEIFSGIYQNTAIFHKMMQFYGFQSN